MLNNLPHHFPNITIRRETPEGTAFIEIVETGERVGEVERINFRIGKAGSSINAYCFALAELCTLLLKSGRSVTEVSSLLVDITSDKSARFGSGDRSGPEALANALKIYLSSLPPLETERKVPKFTNIDNESRSSNL